MSVQKAVEVCMQADAELGLALEDVAHAVAAWQGPITPGQLLRMREAAGQLARVAADIGEENWKEYGHERVKGIPGGGIVEGVGPGARPLRSSWRLAVPCNPTLQRKSPPWHSTAPPTQPN